MLRVQIALHCLVELVASTVAGLVAELVLVLVLEVVLEVVLVLEVEVEQARVPQVVLLPQGQVLAPRPLAAEVVLAMPRATVKVCEQSDSLNLQHLFL